MQLKAYIKDESPVSYSRGPGTSFASLMKKDYLIRAEKRAGSSLGSAIQKLENLARMITLISGPVVLV